MSIHTCESSASLRALDAINAAQSAYEAEQRAREDNVAKARVAVAEIHAIPQSFTEEVAAHLCSVLSARISVSNWSHTDAAERAAGVLDDLHDDLAATN